MWGGQSCLLRDHARVFMPGARRTKILHNLPGLLVSLLALAETSQSPAAMGRRALDLLLAEKYSELSGMLAPVAKDTLTPAFLRDRAGVEINGFGKLGSIGVPVIARDGRNTLVSFPVQFSKVSVNIQFTLTDSGQLAGLYFRPANAPLPPVWQRPTYSRTEVE